MYFFCIEFFNNNFGSGMMINGGEMCFIMDCFILFLMIILVCVIIILWYLLVLYLCVFKVDGELIIFCYKYFNLNEIF